MKRGGEPAEFDLQGQWFGFGDELFCPWLEQLGRRTFAARDHCPAELPAGESQLEVRPATERVLAWAMRQ